jgi:hypothetical protein
METFRVFVDDTLTEFATDNFHLKRLGNDLR